MTVTSSSSVEPTTFAANCCVASGPSDTRPGETSTDTEAAAAFMADMMRKAKPPPIADFNLPIWVNPCATPTMQCDFSFKRTDTVNEAHPNAVDRRVSTHNLAEGL